MPPPPEPLIVGMFCGLGALAVVVLFQILVPGNLDHNGYGFMGTGAVAVIIGWAFGQYRMNRWLAERSKEDDANRT